MRAARTPRARALAAPDPLRAAAAGPSQDQRRSKAGREVSALDLRPRPVRGGRRAGLQEPPGSRARVPRPEVHHRAAAGVSPARAAHPRACPALLARAAADPGRRTPHRPDLAPDQPRAGPAARHHPHRAGRDGRPNHRTHHRPDGHSSGLRPRPATPNHHPQPRLSSTNTLARPPAERGHTPASSPHARSPRSTRRFSPRICPPTAEPGSAFTGDSAHLVSGNQDKTIRVWVVANARPIGQPLAFAPGYLAALVPTADSDRIAAADVTAVLSWP